MRPRQACMPRGTGRPTQVGTHLLQGNAGMGLIHLHSELGSDTLYLGVGT